MKEFFCLLISQWWGILIIVILSIICWLLVSMLFYKCFFKRFYDIFLSGLGLIILSPIILILSILVKVKLGSPIIFKQQRPGKKGKIFTIKKFRTMTSLSDAEGKLLPDKQRMTKFGSFLRSSSLDELPELWNIFIGEMSIVGPRPQLVRDLVFMSENIKGRHEVRGGLTGLAQISGRNNLTWDQRFVLDLKYVEKITMFGDIKIFFKTLGKVFAKADIYTVGMETSEDYGDYLLRSGIITKEEYDIKKEESKTILEAKSK